MVLVGGGACVSCPATGIGQCDRITPILRAGPEWDFEPTPVNVPGQEGHTVTFYAIWVWQ